MIDAITLALVLTTMPAVPVAAPARVQDPAPAAAQAETKKRGAKAQWKSLSPEQRRKFVAARKAKAAKAQWKSLSPEQRQKFAAARKAKTAKGQWKNLSPEQRRKFAAARKAKAAKGEWRSLSPDQRRRFAAARIAKAARDTRPVAPMNPGAAKVRVGPTVDSVPSVKEHVSKKTQPQRVKVQFLPKK